MIREIKFRGKRIDNGEWVYGDYFQSFCENKGYINSTNCLEMNKLDFVEIDYGTVGQFVNTLDDGKLEIYEDDIILLNRKQTKEGSLYNSPKKFICTYDNSLTQFYLKPIDSKTCNDEIFGCTLYNLIKIGNIHDNPELLEFIQNN